MAGETALVNIKVNKSGCLVSNDVLHETKLKREKEGNLVSNDFLYETKLKRKKEGNEGIWN